MEAATTSNPPTLNPVLRDFWTTPARIRVLFGGRSSSKCLALGTRVIMADYSVKAVEDIRIGDQVMGPDGKPRNVLCTNTGEDYLYRVSQANGDPYVVNSDHVLSLRKRPSCANDRGEVMPSGNYRRPRGRYADYPDVVNIPVKEYVKQSKRWKENFPGYKCGRLEFPYVQLPVDPYFLGLWLGDGCYREPNITNVDPEIHEYCESFAGEHNLKFSVYEHNERAPVLSFTKTSGNINPLWKALVDTGVACHREKGNKSSSMKHIPHQYLRAGAQQRLQLLAGFLDADGHYAEDKGSFVVSQSSKAMIDGLCMLARGLGFRASVPIRHKAECPGFSGSAWSIHISGPLGEIPTKVARKQAKVGECGERLRTGISVESVGWGKYAGFGLDGDNLFLLEDHTVTHNTWDAAGFAVYLAANYRVKFLCTRQFQNRIEESVYAVLKVQIERFGLLSEFRVLNNKIIHVRTGSEFIFYGLWRHIDEIKSLEGVDVCWIEEGHNLLEDQWTILRDTLKKEGSQFWIIFNPRLQTDFVWQRFVLDPPSRTIVRKINYDENPFLAQTSLDTIAEVRANDEDEYRHVYLGEPLTDDEAVIIRRPWIEAAIDAHIRLGIEPSGVKRIGFDPADAGEDSNATVFRYGQLIVDCEQWKGGEDRLIQSATHVWAKASEEGAEVGWDAPGVGAHCGSQFNLLNQGKHKSVQIKHSKFQPGGAVARPDGYYRQGVKNRDHFLNLKAQAWWLLADRFRDTYRAIRGEDVDPEKIISIDSRCNHLQQLVTELSTPRRDYNANGKLMVEKKQDMEKRGIKSPNLADAAVIAYAPSTEVQAHVFRRKR